MYGCFIIIIKVMAKDPAFLFYTKDFYEGTRTMLPEERACYIDLLVYQHQHGAIPDDVKRLQMYCSGCSTEVITNVLNLKFKFNQMVNGWLNQRLSEEKINRSESKPKKIASATLAGLISSNKLTKNQITLIKSSFKIDEFIYSEGQIIDLEQIKPKVKEWFYKMVNQMVNNKANANGDANANASENIKGGAGGKTVIAHPFESKEFSQQWEVWKDYKKQEFKFDYKTPQSEQAALVELRNKSSGDEATAIAILHQSMANGWKGFFELKNENNGKNGNTKNGSISRNSAGANKGKSTFELLKERHGVQ